MSIPLLSETEMDAFREVALQGMQDDVLIYRRATISTDDGMTNEWTYLATAKGWVYSVPTQRQNVVSGEIATINTYRLFVPVGTNIREGDKVKINGQEFIVSDTISESTWKALLRVSLRYAE